MKKTVWLDVRKWDKELVKTAIESEVDAVLVAKDKVKDVKELGLIPVASEDKTSDFVLGESVLELTISNKKDEENIASLDKNKIAIVKSNDWTIIPLENLIAQDAKILFPVSNLEEAKMALTVLEKGVWGVLIQTDNYEEIKSIIAFAKEIGQSYALQSFSIKEVQKVAMGDRVCIDTITNMQAGEGMLIGNYSSAFFMVYAETVKNPYVNPRPFRINAGAVHAYIMLPEGKTKYLDELRTGDDVLVVRADGSTYISSVGRVKVEKRPMLNIIATTEEGKEISLVLQNAETIRLTDVTGKPISVVKLKKGDKVLGYTEEGGRHFGFKVQESIEEK